MASKQESRFVLNYNEYRQFSCDREIGILLFSLQPELMILYSKLCSQKTYSGKTFSHNPRLQPMNNSVETKSGLNFLKIRESLDATRQKSRKGGKVLSGEMSYVWISVFQIDDQQVCSLAG